MVANAIVLLVGLSVGLIVVAVMAFRERGKPPTQDRDDEKTTYLPPVDWYKPKTRSIFFLDKEMLTRMSELEILRRIHASIATLDRKVTAHIVKKNTELRVLRSALRDMGGTRVSEGASEGRVAMLHDDMNRVHEDMADLSARVDALEHRYSARVEQTNIT
jgi:hypothetical protein